MRIWKENTETHKTAVMKVEAFNRLKNIGALRPSKAKPGFTVSNKNVQLDSLS